MRPASRRRRRAFSPQPDRGGGPVPGLDEQVVAAVAVEIAGTERAGAGDACDWRAPHLGFRRRPAVEAEDVAGPGTEQGQRGPTFTLPVAFQHLVVGRADLPAAPGRLDD